MPFNVQRKDIDEITVSTGECSLSYYPQAHEIVITDNTRGQVTRVSIEDYLASARLMDRLFRVGEVLAGTEEPLSIDVIRAFKGAS